MKFRVHTLVWGTGGVNPESILKRFVKDTPVKSTHDDAKRAPYFDVEITPEELMAMAASQEFDILISGRGFLAFDGKGRGFKQR